MRCPNVRSSPATADFPGPPTIEKEKKSYPRAPGDLGGVRAFLSISSSAAKYCNGGIKGTLRGTSNFYTVCRHLGFISW